MRNRQQLARSLIAGAALTVAWLPASATDWSTKGKPAPGWQQQGREPVQGPQVQAPPRHRQRAVTRDDYKPLARDVQPVGRAHVTPARPVTGGAKPEATTGGEHRIPSTLRHRNRVVGGPSPEQEKKKKGADGLYR